MLAILAMTISACAVSADAVQPPATEPPDTEPATTPESTGDLSTTPAAVSHGNEVGGYVELVDALRAASATVEPAGEVEQAVFSAKGQKIQINGIEVQVFEYSDEAARKAESDQISPRWHKHRHFDDHLGGPAELRANEVRTAKGRVIVLYLGKDPAILSLFNTVLGDPITQQS